MEQDESIHFNTVFIPNKVEFSLLKSFLLSQLEVIDQRKLNGFYEQHPEIMYKV